MYSSLSPAGPCLSGPFFLGAGTRQVYVSVFPTAAQRRVEVFDIVAKKLRSDASTREHFCFFLEILNWFFSHFWLLFRLLRCRNSCGRPVGFISATPGTWKPSGVRAMFIFVKKLTSKKVNEYLHVSVILVIHYTVDGRNNSPLLKENLRKTRENLGQTKENLGCNEFF